MYEAEIPASGAPTKTIPRCKETHDTCTCITMRALRLDHCAKAKREPGNTGMIVSDVAIFRSPIQPRGSGWGQPKESTPPAVLRRTPRVRRPCPPIL